MLRKTGALEMIEFLILLELLLYTLRAELQIRV
jgi:hypothetical protein